MIVVETKGVVDKANYIKTRIRQNIVNKKNVLHIFDSNMPYENSSSKHSKSFTDFSDITREEIETHYTSFPTDNVAGEVFRSYGGHYSLIIIEADSTDKELITIESLVENYPQEVLLIRSAKEDAEENITVYEYKLD